MRWKNETNLKHGDSRVVRTFLWLPLRFGNETRWLEYAFIKQVYIGVWMDLEWSDNPKISEEKK